MDEHEIRRLRELDIAHVWHPFTQMKTYPDDEPLLIERGEGNYLVDVHGRRYFDAVSSLWANLHGHARPELNAAISEQLAKIAHSTLLGHANIPSIELAARLVAIAPEGLRHVFYSDSGSEAVEIAIKIAFAYWQRKGEPRRRLFVGVGEAYHGDTVGAVSMGGIDLFHSLFRPLLFETRRIPVPYCYRCPLGLERPACGMACLREAERVISGCAEELAAVVVEPVFLAAGGMILQPPGWLAGIARAAKAAGALFVADEVAVGFGRTARMFGCEHEGVAPDILACAKGLSGGYLPLAATLVSDEVYSAFLGEYEEFKTFYHGHTYTGNQLACAAACSSLDIFEKERVLERVRRASERFIARLVSELGERPHVGELRMKGLFGGAELVRDRSTRERYPARERVGHRVCLAARRRGMFMRPLGDVLVFVPPLSSTDDELDALVRAAAESVAEVTEGACGC